MKTFLLFCSLIAGSSLGEILSAKGMQQVGDVSFRPRKLIGAILRMIRKVSGSSAAKALPKPT